MNNKLIQDDSRGSFTSNEESLNNRERPKSRVIAAGAPASSEWRGFPAPPAFDHDYQSAATASEPNYQSVAYLPSHERVQLREVDELSLEKKLPFMAGPSKGLGRLTLQEQEKCGEQDGINYAPLDVSKIYCKPGWNFSRIHVLQLPVYHRIERFNTKFPKENIEVVLLNLQDTFCADSLTVQYLDGSDTETALARCLSMDGVKFVVQVWQSSNTEHIVEIQRTGGDIMLFSQYRYAKRILDVIKRCSGLPATDQVPPPVGTAPADPFYVSHEAAQEDQRRIDVLFKLHNVPAPTDQDALSSIEIAGENLASDRFDRVAMGLQIVMCMTDPSKSGCTMALKSSKTVLLGDEKAPEMVKKMPDTIAFLAFSGRPLPTMDQTDAKFANYHAFSALTIVAQAVNIWDEDSTKVFVERVTKQGLKPIEVLLYGIDNAGTGTHVAYLSAHILAAVCRAVPSIREKVRTQFRPVVEHANHVGVCTHAALARASKRLLHELSVTT